MISRAASLGDPDFYFEKCKHGQVDREVKVFQEVFVEQKHIFSAAFPQRIKTFANFLVLLTFG